MVTEALIPKLRERVGRSDMPQARVLFELNGEGALFVDATSSPPSIEARRDDADVTIEISPGHLDDVLDGRLDPTVAFMTGRLKVRGAMPIAMQLAKVLA